MDKQLAIKIWAWIIDSFPTILKDDGNGIFTQSEEIGNAILGNMREEDDREDQDFIFKYLSLHPRLETKLFENYYYRDIPYSLVLYLSYCMKNDLEENFFRVYKGFINNPIRNREKEDDSDLIGKVIHDFYFYGSYHMPEKYYDFLMSEIDKLGKPIVSAALIKRIEQAENEADEYYDSDPRKELYDGREDEEDEDDEDDNYLGFIDVLDGIGKELSQLRAKYADMEEEVKRLTKEVKILRSKDEPQEFYCKVRLDREPAGWGLWYKCSDRTVCAGDRVIVPYGKDNERLAGEVVETGYFKSCDFDFSMDKMKNIIEIKK